MAEAAETPRFPRIVPSLVDQNTGAKHYSFPNDIFDVIEYKRVKQIGSGSTSTVYQLACPRKKDMAAKVISFEDSEKGMKSRQRFLREVAILQQLSHSNIAKCMFALVCPTYGIIMMDYFRHGPLSKNLDTLSDMRIRQFFIQILYAIQYIHTRRIIHRDIKLDNVLIAKNQAYLCDFGLSCRLGNDSSMVSGRVGTPIYMAPEARAALVDTEYDGFKADSFSLGVILWSMLVREEPTMDTKFLEVIETKKKCCYKIDIVLLKCVRCLLREDPKDRKNVIELLAGIRMGVIIG